MKNKKQEEALNILLKRYKERIDLQKAFPEAQRGDYKSLIKWALGVSSRSLKDGDNYRLSKFKDDYLEINETFSPLLVSLTTKEENTLEKKFVWIFGSARSGSTWLGTQLLNHKENIVWNEPYIGWHLDALPIGVRNREDYIFSKKYENIWLKPLKKLILARGFSHAKTLTKNIVIKEPNGSGAAGVIMKAFPNSKLVFLIRDGRDYVDSQLDTHNAHSWARDIGVNKKKLVSEKDRLEFIKYYSHEWSRLINIVSNAFQNHNPNLRFLIKYEDLKKDTLTNLKKIYQFLEISVHEKELQKLIERHDFKNIPEQQKGVGKFTRFASPGMWKENFNEEEKKLMKSIMEKSLTQMSYEL